MTQTASKTPKEKTERLEARVSGEQKELFQQAANIEGQTLTEFVTSSATQAAKRAIQEHEMINLSVRDREVFIEALLNPPEPSNKLRAAAQRYKQNMGASGDATQQF